MVFVRSRYAVLSITLSTTYQICRTNPRDNSDPNPGWGDFSRWGEVNGSSVTQKVCDRFYRTNVQNSFQRQEAESVFS